MPRAKNTIIRLSADHCIVPTVVLLDLMRRALRPEAPLQQVPATDEEEEVIEEEPYRDLSITAGLEPLNEEDIKALQEEMNDDEEEKEQEE